MCACVCMCACVLGNLADFRALGIKRQRSSSSLPILHIYSISREEKPWCVLSAVVINSLETSSSFSADFMKISNGGSARHQR